MLAKLEMKLKCAQELSCQMASLFHGALMELLPLDYAEALHQSQLHPYTQHLEFKNQSWYWIVSCLNREAVKGIICDTLLRTECIELKKKEISVEITERKYQELGSEELLEHFYEGQASCYLQVHFVTPTAFKQKGRYLFYPDLRCIYQSLMNKYDAAAGQESMRDEETLDELCEKSQIIRYDLKSVNFHLEGVKIPSYIGKVTIKFSGTQTMANFANLLFEFGVYSGVGIKTSLGMGAIRIIEERGKKSDRKSD